MSSPLRSLFLQLGALGVIVSALLFIADLSSAPSAPEATSQAAATVVSSPVLATTTPRESVEATTTPSQAATEAPSVAAKPVPAIPKQENTALQSDNSDLNQVHRVEDPYTTAPLSFDTINLAARAALVNILCMPKGGSLRPVSGSGVIIDPRGVILTNAHVAQYVLLSEDPRVDLACYVRSGAPARARWSATVLYIPPVWVREHALELTDPRPTGTGEHDYALLLITHSLDSTPLPAISVGGFPFIPPDTREGIAFVDDAVLAASYPAEFIGGIAAQYGLFPASSVTTIKDLLTFRAGTIDLISIGGIIEAQSGSSGGAVVNAWQKLVGVITTTSDGETTAERDLRAVTLSYIDRDLKAQRGAGLAELLTGDIAAKATDFTNSIAPGLIHQLVTPLQH